MTETEFQLVRGAGFTVALVVALGLERMLPHAPGRASWRENGVLWATNLVVMSVVCGACACTVSRWADAHGVGLFASASAPAWIAIPLSVLALDFVSYGWHRANHTFGFLWRFHQVHHSDPTFTATTAVRFHPGELLLSLPLRLSAVALLGVPIVAVIVFEVAFALANFVEHGNINVPLAFERGVARIFVTPALHRRHHSSRRSELNSNYATIFSFWDRLLGSYGESSSSLSFPIGLSGVRGPVGALRALTLPVRETLRGE
jgi:sterol desaturase/sphingolipid hydroxylase (fatty acid hydroxylase superfamily)